MACSSTTSNWHTETYIYQRDNFWPRWGNHILAQFDENTVVVYQAFKPSIADFAVEHQQFGGDDFSWTRMSWVKTNFLWMTYRCGWANKKNQDRVLAVRITRDGFATILAHAWTAEYQRTHKRPGRSLRARLQWDPDHTPTYEKAQRRAIQLGLKGELLELYATKMIVSITDITDFVKEQYQILQEKGVEHIEVAKERVFTDVDPEVAARIELSKFDPDDLEQKKQRKEALAQKMLNSKNSRHVKT